MKGAIKFVLAVIVVALLFIGYDKLAQKKDAQKPDAHDANSHDSWSYEEPIDKVTGNKQYRATRTVALDIGGTAEMTANCKSFWNGNHLVISIVFFDKNRTGIDIDPLGFKDNSGSFRYSESQGLEGSIEVERLHTNEIGIEMNSEIAPSFANAQFAKIEVPLLVEGEKPVIDLRNLCTSLRPAFLLNKI